jgi:hypothetical protein
MSDHPQPEPEHGHETRDANVSTIVFVGCVMVAAAAVIHVGVWGLFDYFKRREDRAKTTHNPLVRSQMNQLPAQPRLEAFEPTHARVVLKTADGKEQVFYVDTEVTVVRRQEGVGGKGEPMNLYDVLRGTEVVLTYLEPQGLYGRPRVVRIEVGGGAPGGSERPAEGGVGTVTGTIEKIDPESGPDFRGAAEADLRRAGWVDREKEVAHIPIEQAMRILVDQKMLKSRPEKAEGKAGQGDPDANAGRGAGEGRR